MIRMFVNVMNSKISRQSEINQDIHIIGYAYHMNTNTMYTHVIISRKIRIFQSIAMLNSLIYGSVNIIKIILTPLAINFMFN